MRTIFLLLFALLPCLSSAQTQSFVLHNGLKILVKEDHRAPVAVVMVWYDVGSADDPSGITGISHVLEHLMFKGTAKYPTGVFSKTIANLGGQENAFTSHDYTAYFEKIAAKDLTTSFTLEADRMQHLTLDEQEFSKEIKVIQEERRQRIEDNPQALTFERFLAAAHLITPYHQPVIGWMNDLKHLTINDVRAWYRRFYAPNHATLVVVGDVSPSDVHTLAEKTFGSLKAREKRRHKPQIEPPARGKKTLEVHVRAQVPMLLKGYTVPSVKTTNNTNLLEPYALEVLATLLDTGDSGRLPNHLTRETSIASNVGVQYDLYTRYQTQFILYGVPSASHTLNALSDAMDKEIKQLQTQLVSEKELQRAKTQLIAQKTFERDSILGQAMELGLLETIGLGWDTVNTYEERIRQITPQHIQAVVKRYFQTSRETNTTLIPLKETSV